MKFRSLRWRIASFYTLLLVAVIVLAGIVLQIELRRILLDAAQARVDSIGNDIARLVQRNEMLSVIGDALPIDQELTTPGNLDHWASPSTFVEIDTPAGYPEGKSTNMGGATLGPSRLPRRAPRANSGGCAARESLTGRPPAGRF